MRTFRKLFSMAGAAVALGLLAVAATAQPTQAEGRPVERPQAPTESFKAELSRAQALLAPAEDAVRRIESARRATKRDTAVIDKGMEAYARAFNTLFEQATSDAKLASETKGKRGNVGNFLLFEEVATAEVQRVKDLEARLQKLGSLTERGEVRLQAASDAPEPDEPVSLLGPLVGAYESVVACFGGGWESWELIPAAEAAIVLPCVSPCANKNWGACLQCIVSKAPAAISAWNQFWNCWNSASGWLKAWKRAQCLWKFIQTLA